MKNESTVESQIYYDLLLKAKVKVYKLRNNPILKIEDFEFMNLKIYPPIILRFLINSINIFNKIFDDNKKQINNFPIGIEAIEGEEGEHHILYCIHK